ncbi:transcription antitermination factor NusB [Candidatus Saccharibacteria bacterium RIFCSPHIGHO2_12_FULL_49_19]|nr:MAG: transcription antitermination factor NusB [Candidatus Saccharibacteria bacterium RIFCSPHIGHO2_01_FULL_49_21]OGL36424.1 MAG: transcription antitermination factor NusB [Candidatus Saccharibacteria bacterium RIFCSPHIGHO2_12_FULL_49_19]OGL37948.1 MAG: transcription antitermination factor NusB [Candidatus Saccharibacteria bacterium RIFCSPLOWO2_01_FULL_49_22]
MSANRHLGRIVALQTLYEQDFRKESGDKTLVLDQVLNRNFERYSDTIEDKRFVEDLVQGVDKNAEAIDEIIRPVAPEWPIEQIARIDRSILRMGVFELLFDQKVPPKVAINEAVELAKAFGGDNSSKFVNGVLGTVLRNKESKAKPKASRKTKTSKSKSKSKE